MVDYDVFMEVPEALKKINEPTLEDFAKAFESSAKVPCLLKQDCMVGRGMVVDGKLAIYAYGRLATLNTYPQGTMWEWVEPDGIHAVEADTKLLHLLFTMSACADLYGGNL